MSGIERGVRNISVLKVGAIARALGVQPASLFAKERLDNGWRALLPIFLPSLPIRRLSPRTREYQRQV